MNYNVISAFYEIYDDYDENESGTLCSAAYDSRAIKTREKLISTLREKTIDRVLDRRSRNIDEVNIETLHMNCSETDSVINKDIHVKEIERIVIRDRLDNDYIIGILRILEMTPRLIKANESDIGLFTNMRTMAKNVNRSGNLINRVENMPCKDYLWSISYLQDVTYDEVDRGHFSQTCQYVSKDLTVLLTEHNSKFFTVWDEYCRVYNIDNSQKSNAVYYQPITPMSIYNRYKGEEWRNIYDDYRFQSLSDEDSGLYLQARLELIPVVSSYDNR